MSDCDIERRINRLENLVIALFAHTKAVNKRLHELTLRYPDLVGMQIEIEKEIKTLESFMRVKR
ncbi:MAG: hypothetical protein ACRC2V_26915 [Xenococcaceae cyanobacterium]